MDLIKTSCSYMYALPAHQDLSCTFHMNGVLTANSGMYRINTCWNIERPMAASSTSCFSMVASLTDFGFHSN